MIPARSRYLWPAVAVAVVLLIAAGWIWVTRPTELEMLGGRIKVGMPYEEVEGLVNSYKEREGKTALRMGNDFLCFGVGDEILDVSCDGVSGEVTDVIYSPPSDRPSRLSRLWMKLFGNEEPTP